MNIKKTPIILQFSDPLEANTTITKQYTNYKVVITTKASDLTSIEQFLPQKYILKIPTNGRLELELIPTDYSDPDFRYRVQYYANGNLYDEQYWKVPKAPFDMYSTIEVIAGEYALPNNIYQVIDIKPEVEYTVTDRILYINIDGEYTIRYTPALTLHDVVVDNE
jgi:hypothetical protein